MQKCDDELENSIDKKIFTFRRSEEVIGEGESACANDSVMYLTQCGYAHVFSSPYRVWLLMSCRYEYSSSMAVFS